MIGNPTMCAECGYLHGHHAVSCGRQRMTGEQLYLRMQERVGELVADLDPRDRHHCIGKLIHIFCEMVREAVPPALWREFDAAMFAHGYHKRLDDLTGASDNSDDWR